jgi:hypothetical protein
MLSAKDILIILFRGLGLFLLQVGVLQELHIQGYAYPMVQVLFILLMPYNIAPALLLVIGFGYGYLLDVFCNGSGIYAGSLVATAYFRKYILALIRPLMGYDKDTVLNLQNLGSLWFAKYLFLSLLIHNLSFYFLDSLSLHNMLFTLLKAISGILLSFIILWIINLLFIPTKFKRR